MKIVRYGIRLERLTGKNLEMVRQWRNDARIKQHMFYNADISEEQQQAWFSSIDNINNFYFVIYTNNKAVGVINISEIHWTRKTAQTGLYIYDEAYIGTDVPVRASLAMLDVFFLLLGINTAFAKVKGDNETADKYNTNLGFERTKEIEGGAGYEYKLSKADYLLKAKKPREALIKLNSAHTVIELHTDNKVGKWLQEQLHWADKVADIDLQVVISNHPST